MAGVISVLVVGSKFDRAGAATRVKSIPQFQMGDRIAVTQWINDDTCYIVTIDDVGMFDVTPPTPPVGYKLATSFEERITPTKYLHRWIYRPRASLADVAM